MKSHLFRGGLRRLLPGTATVSSITAMCYLYAADDDYWNDATSIAGNPNAAIWQFSSLAKTPTTTTTQCLARNQSASNENPHILGVDQRPHLLFLGTGSSSGCPRPSCALEFHKTALRGNSNTVRKSSNGIRPDSNDDCHTSFRALAGGDPRTNPNYRNNPSLLIHHYDQDSKTYKNIIIDVGKTFRETALRWFPINNIESLDAIILTHHHMDATAGLDDVRGFQGIKWAETTNGQKEKTRVSIPLYMSSFCQLNLQSQFPWLLPKKSGPSVMPQQSKGRPTVKRDVASFDVTIFKDFQKEIIAGTGFAFVPLPVWHGDDLISHGFAFSLDPGPSSEKRSLNVVYLSDISRMVPETLDYIQKELPPTDVLIVDTLLWDREHSVHFCMEQALDLARTLQPRMGTYLIGMSCDTFWPHDEMNAYLRTTYGKSETGGTAVAMAHDGLVVDLPDANNWLAIKDGNRSI